MDDNKNSKLFMKQSLIPHQIALAMVKTIGSSKGSQPKFLDNGYWYKKNFKGYEGKAEYLVSKILECSNLSNYVKYEECLLNGAQGCRSADFTKDGEMFMSLEKMHEQYLGTSLADKIAAFSNVEDRVNYTIDFVFQFRPSYKIISE